MRYLQHLVVSADPRISVEKHRGVNSLGIKHITEYNAGGYVCQLGNFQISRNLYLVDKLLIIVYLDIE